MPSGYDAGVSQVQLKLVQVCLTQVCVPLWVDTFTPEGAEEDCFVKVVPKKLLKMWLVTDVLD